MRIFKWTPCFNSTEESPLIIPVWVSLPGLPYHLFHKKAVMDIASALGYPMKIGKATSELSRPSHARVFVEVDASRELPSKVWINLPEGRSKFQCVEYETTPVFCNHCRHQGHVKAHCSVLAKEKGKAPMNSVRPCSGVDREILEEDNQVIIWTLCPSVGGAKCLREGERC
ncbi:Uncharacterized protein M6B38_221620 [Iris pallida]|uniref:DUF4283 domain-containing protein n=1 Tax=Iris pallida TaxID=29817 RepID=A0AAX6DWG6_IRIPA|nr:Uncharacterized protein M6B38_221620 [Iris pallida]